MSDGKRVDCPSCGTSFKVPHINWQPIATAPTDGLILLGRMVAGAVEWAMDRDQYDSDICCTDLPTHWCELEAPCDE